MDRSRKQMAWEERQRQMKRKAIGQKRNKKHALHLVLTLCSETRGVGCT